MSARYSPARAPAGSGLRRWFAEVQRRRTATQAYDNVDGAPACSTDYMTEYLNLPAVQVCVHVCGARMAPSCDARHQSAIHIAPEAVQWEECTDPPALNYSLPSYYGSMIPAYRELFASAPELLRLLLGAAAALCL